MPKIVVIDKRKLKNLYTEKKLGSYEIAKIFNCSPSLIRKRLHEYFIKTRSIQEAKALTKPLYKRNNFRGVLKEKAYLIGFRLGDLYVSKTHPNSPTIRISTNTTKREQLNLVKELFSKYGHVKEYNRDKRGAISIRCFVNNSFSFLIKKDDYIENWILKDKKYFLSFLAGYIDAEGSFVYKHNSMFCLQTQDKNIIWKIYSNLNKYGIKCVKPVLSVKAGNISGNSISNKDVWLIYIYNKRNLLRLIKLVGKLLRHKKRKNDMSILLNKINNYVRP